MYDCKKILSPPYKISAGAPAALWNYFFCKTLQLLYTDFPQFGHLNSFYNFYQTLIIIIKKFKFEITGDNVSINAQIIYTEIDDKINKCINQPLTYKSLKIQKVN